MLKNQKLLRLSLLMLVLMTVSCRRQIKRPPSLLDGVILRFQYETAIHGQPVQLDGEPIPRGRTKRAGWLMDFDKVVITFEFTAAEHDWNVVLDGGTAVITDKPALRKIRKLYHSMRVSPNASEPLTCPRFRVRFLRQDEIVAEWHMNQRMTSSSELKRKFDLGNCTVENEESIYACLAEIYAASQTAAIPPSAP